MQVTVQPDEITARIAALFDHPFTGRTEFTPPQLPMTPENFNIGVIVGPSGSGKSSMLREYFGCPTAVEWAPTKAIVSHFTDEQDAIARLGGAGLNSIPSWLRPYHALSTGEQFRADLARRLQSGAVIDEFTSVVDRTVARSCSVAIAKYIRQRNLEWVVFATCHYDVIRWLQPDWVFDTRTCTLHTGRWQSRSQILVDILPCGSEAWPMFQPHHYLDGSINKSAHCWLATIGDTPVGFASALAFPNRNFTNAWREHRTVVLPDFQGLGLGVRLSDAVAQLFLSRGCRYFSKTAHPRMGWYRDHSSLWRPTSKNHKGRLDYLDNSAVKERKYQTKHAMRVCYSHEYIGC